MTSKQNKLSAPAKPAPAELRDEALDRAQGGYSGYSPLTFRKEIDKSTP